MGLCSSSSQFQVSTFEAGRSVGIEAGASMGTCLAILVGSEVDPLRKTTASAADRRTAPAVMLTLDLLTLDGLFKGFDAATDLVGFSDSTLGGQDVCNLFLKFDSQIPVGAIGS